jgi:SAM-dependent methyltransferase
MHETASQSALMRKVIAGEPVSSQDWRDYFCAFHSENPSGTVEVFGRLRDPSGQTSYQVLASAIPRAASALLDVACGDGSAVVQYREANPHCEVTGVDICAASVERAQAIFGDAKTRFLCAPATELPFEERQFDFVAAHLSLLLIQPVEDALREIRRVLKPGGTAAFIIEEPLETGGEFKAFVAEGVRFLRAEYPRFTPVQANPHLRTRAAIQASIALCGFREIRFDSFRVSDRMIPPAVVDFITGAYIFGSLDDRTNSLFSAHMLRYAREREDTAGTVRVTFPLCRVTCR